MLLDVTTCQFLIYIFDKHSVKRKKKTEIDVCFKRFVEEFHEFFLQMSKLSSIINFAKSAIEDVEKKNAKSKTKVLFFVNQILLGEKK